MPAPAATDMQPSSQNVLWSGDPVNAFAVVEDEVRELVRRRGLDPVADPGRRPPPGRRGDRGVRRPQPDRRLPKLVDLRLAAHQVFDAVAGSVRCRSTSTTPRSRRSGSTSV
ncbi:MAG: hypothetical protein H0X00_01060 [Sporichthya sp.]|nr:hypothetical protein [Sporichthya sp.]